MLDFKLVNSQSRNQIKIKGQNVSRGQRSQCLNFIYTYITGRIKIQEKIAIMA